MITVSVKWQKKVFPAIEIDTSQPPLLFKAQLYDLTGVPPERQKIMVKGGLLKDDVDWSTSGIKEGQKLMMMGTADEIVKAPEKGPVFMEDLPEEDQVVAIGHSAGLYNLGNTCYMNSTLQCLHSVPELKSALLSYGGSGRSNELDQNSHHLAVATRNLFNELDQSVKPVAPLPFLSALRQKYPQFSQQHNGVYMQQDAEECWTQLMYTLLQSMKSSEPSETSTPVKTLFEIDFVNRVYCAESGEESFEKESVYALKCHISQDVNHLHEGLKHGLKSELEKVSLSLGHSAIYTKESCIGQLPRYLSVQFVRFFWKRESNQKAKILRKVNYPLELDVYDFCTEELQHKLTAPRQALRDVENAKFGLKVEDKTNGSKENEVDMAKPEGSSGGNAGATKTNGKADEVQLTGIYDLVAVLTHKGRSADSGHYVAWVKQEDGKWIEYDDDKAIFQREDDITKLSGGGEYFQRPFLCSLKHKDLNS